MAFGGWLLPWRTPGLPSASRSILLPQLEAQLHGLRSSHRAAGSENQQLRETEQELAGQLEEARGHLRVTRGRLSAARGHASWQVEEEPRRVAAAPGPLG